MIKLISWLYKPFVVWRWVTLARLINKHSYWTFVEVGVWKATNMRNILRLCPGLKRVWAVDPYVTYTEKVKGESMTKASQEEFNEIYYWIKGKLSYDKRVKMLRMSSSKARERFENESIDIVFLDAEHTLEATKHAIQDWLPKIRKGGILAGHNYEVKYFGVIIAVNSVLGCDDVTIFPDSVWVYKK